MYFSDRLERSVFSVTQVHVEPSTSEPKKKKKVAKENEIKKSDEWQRYVVKQLSRSYENKQKYFKYQLNKRETQTNVIRFV